MLAKPATYKADRMERNTVVQGGKKKEKDKGWGIKSNVGW